MQYCNKCSPEKLLSFFNLNHNLEVASSDGLGDHQFAEQGEAPAYDENQDEES